MLRNTFARVDLAKIGNNIETLKKAAGTQVMAIVKADAYGHGMIRVAGEAINHGVSYFAVATADEAVEFRRNYKKPSILILSSVVEEDYTILISNNIELTVYTAEDILALDIAAKKLDKQALVHIKVDTGMGRIVMRTKEELEEVISALKASKNITVKGLFTHFATADEADFAFTELQFERFIRIKERFLSEGFSPLCHASNSAGILWHKDKHLDLCRMGISMYGYPPSGEVELGEARLEPAMELISYITHVKEIEAGESVSYGRRFTASERRKVATVAIGYADGYRRALTNKGRAFIRGNEVKQVGTVCMDQLMLDVTGMPVKKGDEVLLMGAGYDADDMAADAGTISYEILCGISGRVPRVYE